MDNNVGSYHVIVEIGGWTPPLKVSLINTLVLFPSYKVADSYTRHYDHVCVCVCGILDIKVSDDHCL